MKILLTSDEAIRLEANPGPLQIEAASPDVGFSAFHMLAAGFAFCTVSVLHAWADSAKLDANDLTIDLGWTFGDDPHRVAKYDLRFNWPSLPESRLQAARRVAESCTVHATFRNPPEITIDGTNCPPSPAAPSTDDVHAQADGADSSAPPTPANAPTSV